MKKIICLLLLSILLVKARSQSASIFTVQNISNTFTISCSIPVINLIAFSDFSYPPLTYSWVSQSSALSGSNVIISSAGIYTVEAYSGQTFASSQTLSIFSNTSTPSSILNPFSQTITCSPLSVTNVTASAINSSLSVTHLFCSPYGGTLAINSFSTEYTPSGTGTFTYILKDNASNCVDTKTFSIISSGGFPVYSLASPQNFSLGCQGADMAVVNITNLDTYPISGGSLSHSLIGIPTSSTALSYTFTNPVTLTLSVKDLINSCEVQTPFTITQNTLAPSAFILAPTQTLTCAMPQVLLQGYTGSANANLYWSFQGNSWGVLPNPITVYTSQSIPPISIINSYVLLAFDYINLCLGTSEVLISQNIYRPTLTAPPPFNVLCPNPTVQISAVVNGDASNCTFLYQMPMSVYVSSPQNPTLTVNAPGLYNISLTNTLNSCTASTQLTVAICVGLDEEFYDDFSIRVYPNPFSSKITFNFSDSDINESEALIINTLGQSVFKLNSCSLKQELDLSFLNSGIYFLKWRNSEKQKTIKLIKE